MPKRIRTLSPLGRFIRKRMRELGIRHQKDVAEFIGMTEGGFTDLLYEEGRKPRDETLKRLAAYLQVPLANVHAVLGRRTAITPEESDLMATAITLLSQIPENRLADVLDYLDFEVQRGVRKARLVDTE